MWVHGLAWSTRGDAGDGAAAPGHHDHVLRVPLAAEVWLRLAISASRGDEPLVASTRVEAVFSFLRSFFDDAHTRTSVHCRVAETGGIGGRQSGEDSEG